MRLFAALLFVSALAFAQDPPKQGGGGGGRQAPKNLKILQPQDVGRVMRTFTTGLGVRCDFCHMQGDFASDENPKKEIARHMIGMAKDINGKFPDGKEHVTCYTCHRGENIPKMTPPPAAPAQ